MGYGVSTTLIYGFALTEQQAEQLYEAISDEELTESWFTPEKDRIYRRCSDAVAAHSNETTWASHATTLQRYPSTVFDLCMQAADTDSRCHDTMYEKGYDHFFGVRCGSQGYGGIDKVAALTKDAIANQDFLRERLHKLAGKLIADLGTTTEPDIHIVSQYI